MRLRLRLISTLTVAAIMHNHLARAASSELLPTSLFVRVAQSSDASSTNLATRALDGSNATASLTQDVPESYWTAVLGRPFPLDRLELVNRAAPADKELGGLTLRLLNIDDQVVFETVLTNPGPASMLTLGLPSGLLARSVWIGLPGNQTNAAGNHRVGIAELRSFGSLAIPFAPDPVLPPTNHVVAYQSSSYSSSFPPSNALDGDPATFTHTADLPDSYWMLDLGIPQAIDRVELVNREDCCAARLGGLVLRILDATSNSVASATVTNPGLGGTWSYNAPTGTIGRFLRVGLENGQLNSDGNHYVTLAEVRVFSGSTNLTQLSTASVPVTSNFASHKKCYMVRFLPTLPSPTNANDDSFSTEMKTTTQTVDGYWEVDAGATYALYGVRAIAASGIGGRLTNATLRIFDEGHNSVFAARLHGTPDVFDSDLNGPVFGRFIRIGLEDKQRTDPAGGLEWYIGMREVEVFGRPTNEVGILNFSSSDTQIASGQSATLSWNVADVRRIEIHPSLGSVGAQTATSGQGNLTLTPTNPVEFTLITSNAAGVFASSVAIEVDSQPVPVRINEVVANNAFSMQDGYGDASDWIELRNPGNSAVNLAGYGLSDDPAKPMKWVFPATNLAPHSLLVIFASGRSTAFDPAGNLHASFRLSKDGSQLLLTAPDSLKTVDAVSYPGLDTDLAYGRDLDNNWSFLEPTPGRVNAASSYSGWLRPPEFSRSRGFYDTPFTLTITNASPGATVFYSLDGSVPSLQYGLGLSLASSRAVRAQARRAGYRSSRIQTQTYVFVNSVITSSVMQTAVTQNPSYAPRMRPGLLSLPSVSIATSVAPGYEEAEASVEILWPDGRAGAQANCGLSVFGGSWESYAKSSFRVKCHATHGTSKLTVPLFDGFDRGLLARQSFDELEFRAGDQDMYERGFYMAGRFVEDSLLDMGDLNPHGRFVHLYLNGVYWGEYDAREPLVEHMLADYLGGSPEQYLDVKGNDNVGDTFILGTPSAPRVEPWDRVLALKSSYSAVRPYLDVSALIDFMLMWLYGDCESEFRACGAVDAGTGFKFWEADADGFLRTDALGLDRTGNPGPAGLFGALVGEGNSDFKTLLADRIYRHCFNNGALTPARNDMRLADRMHEVHDSLLAECARWGYRTPASWESAAALIRSNLFPARTAQLVSQLRARNLYPTLDPPTFTQYGGLVTAGYQPQLSAATGTIYYTLDGSDPRMPGGGISSNARVWNAGAVSVNQDLTLNARVLSPTGQWSALAQPRFLLASRRVPNPSDLLITEIQYNPAGSDDYEFIELWNAGTNLLDLSGVSLTNSVRFIFRDNYVLTPGAFAVVVKSVSAFAQRYQDPASPWYWPRIEVAGEWIGNLGNQGDSVLLMSSNGLPLLSVSYQTGGDWPQRANAGGSSLELRSLPQDISGDDQVRAFVADGRNWTPSSLYHGSPGRFDVSEPSVRINEVMSHPATGDDWIELFNPGPQPVDLTGCALTDDIGLPLRWSFAPGTTLPPGQFMVLTSSQLGFGFSKLGESAAVLRVSGTNIIRFLDSVDFPAADVGEPLGLFERSDGVLDLTELRSGTPGGSNALPRVGPLVFSEILCTPAPGLAQFIQLANITSAAVELFDSTHPTNVWKIKGIGNFSLPAGVVLSPCSTLVLCSTNPADFRAQYGLSASVPVFGPWPGSLSPSGEALELVRPGTPEPDGTVPYYRVDHVSYRSDAPWPPALSGTSLVRLPLEAYGNDPVYWTGSSPNGTPGVTPTNRPPVIRVAGDQTVAGHAAMTLQLSTVDLDVPWQSVTLLSTLLPPGAYFDSVSGIFQWTPSSSQGPGLYEAAFTAIDSSLCGPAQTTLTLTLVVIPELTLSIHLVPGGAQLTFPTLAGQHYFIEYSDSAVPADWQLVEEVASAPGEVMEVIDSPAQPASRFYRVRWAR